MCNKNQGYYLSNDETDEFYENVIFICDFCGEEYTLPEDTILCPICNNDTLHI